MTNNQIFEIEVAELETPVVIKFLEISPEDLEKLPFERTIPSQTSHEIQQRISWVVSRCVENLDEVKEEIAQKSDRLDPNSVLLTIYQCCIAINPSFDTVQWLSMTRQKGIYNDELNAIPLSELPPSLEDFKLLTDMDIMIDEDTTLFLMPPPWSPPSQEAKSEEQNKVQKIEPIDRKQILSLNNFMKKNLIGQDEAVDELTKTLKRSAAGLKDESRPLGVFFLAGPSGCGKSESAKLIQKHLFGTDHRIVRIDCGEYQQKHESTKLLGSPAGYVAYEEGGHLTNAVKENPNTVVLLDEAEKAHPDFWNVFLRIFDEGYVTSNNGEQISFENTIIILTSNIGNDTVASKTFTKGVGFNSDIEDSYDSDKMPPRSLVERETKAAINKYFKPEFVNRLDSIIIFNYLDDFDLEKIAKLEMKKLQKKLSKQKISLRWNKTVEKALAINSRISTQGARAMARTRRNEIEDTITHQILTEEVTENNTIKVSAKKDGERYKFSVMKLPTGNEYERSSERE